MKPATTLRSLALVLLVGVLGCSGYGSYRQAQIAEQQGEWDQAVLHYLELVDQYPTNLAYKTGLLRAKIRSSREHFERAKELHRLGALEAAQREYQQAVRLDPSNQYAQVELEKVSEQIQEARRTDGPESFDDLKAKAQAGRPQPPVLNPRSDEPISLSFPNKVSDHDIYRALGKAFGINIQFDPKLRPRQITLELEEVTAQEALEILMRTSNHFYKVLSEDTIIVVEDTPQNRRKYEDLVIQTFFLSNAEVKDMMTMLRALIGAKNIASNDQLNAIVLRDTADKVKVAERIILTNDKSRGEVVVDVELLQIDTGKMQDLGVSLSEYSVSQTLDQDPALRVSDLEFLNQGDWILTLPSFIYEFVKNSTEAQLLASPQIRISDGEQASLTIGSQVPIPVTSFNTSQTVGGNIVPITSFQYQDIGIRLELEPRIHHNREITLNVQVEVSNLSGFVEGSGGQQQPIIGTRNIQSTIRLEDGETNFLAGLIRNDQTNTEVGMPGLAEIPILGRLFSSKSDNLQRTDLVLTLTPHIIRTPDVTEEDLQPIWVGTEANITFRGGSPSVESDVAGPFDEEGDDEEQRIRDLIRRRIQSLPQGLRDAEEGDEGADPEPGQELVPVNPPADPFEEEEPPGGPDLAPWHPLRDGGLATAEEVFLAAAEVGGGGGGASQGSVIALEPEPSVVAVGDSFEVRVVATTDAEVSHLPMTLDYDPAALAVEQVDRGSFLGPKQRSTVLADVSRPGRIVLGASRLGKVQGVAGEGTVATIRFRALREGATSVSFERAKALDRELERLQPLTRKPARIMVTPDGIAPGGAGVEIEGRPEVERPPERE